MDMTTFDLATMSINYVHDDMMKTGEGVRSLLQAFSVYFTNSMCLIAGKRGRELDWTHLFPYGCQCANWFLAKAIYGRAPRGMTDLVAYIEEHGLPENGPARSFWPTEQRLVGIMTTFAGQVHNRYSDLFIDPEANSNSQAKFRTFSKRPAWVMARGAAMAAENPKPNVRMM